MATLTYSSVRQWIALAFKAKALLDTQGYDLSDPEHAKQAVRDIAVEAADMGFALGVGHRWYGLTELLYELDNVDWNSETRSAGPLYNAWMQLNQSKYKPPRKQDLGHFPV